MIAAETIIAKKTLKIKFPSQQREAVSGSRASGQQSSFVRTWGAWASVDENSHPKMDKPQTIVSVGNKRGPPMSMECQQAKRLKMDRSLTQRCSTLVKSLIFHPAGWVFKEPVDPVKLKIHDYFSIIKKPMDLGTIKSKLDKNQYVAAEDFAADIRLTFSNAMLYNPPTNSVHQMAVELNEVFETQWRSLEGKWSHDWSKVGSGKLLSASAREMNKKVQSHPRTPVHQSVVLRKKTKAAEGKMMRSTLDLQASDVKLVRQTENCVDKSSGQISLKGTGSGDRLARGSVKEQPALSAVATKWCACIMVTCRCSLHTDSTQASSDLSYERPTGRELSKKREKPMGGDHLGCGANALKLDFQEKDLKASQLTKSDPDSDGAVSALDEETVCPSSKQTIAINATPGEGRVTSPFDVQLSPTKALRAAMLKQRFADTILKAQHKTLHEHGDKADLVKIRLEKERLEKRQQEERAWIEAQIRAAEAACQKREKMELRKQRERQREAARLALQKMENTAGIEQNLEIQNELEMLCGCSLPYSPRFERERAKGEKEQFGSPLEQLGLFIKDEAEDEDEEIVNRDGEEGEIL